MVTTYLGKGELPSAAPLPPDAHGISEFEIGPVRHNPVE